ncbi:MAG: hypothetical protein K2W79_11695 [Hydrotalea flava]|uniref:hypothetical protein n=2 Tax=Chitinophagaceae TaxID=563835 RepID=UPI000943597C|nr:MULTISPECIES: hypothetical protein [Hydrotalea]MBY0348913.1 hypothetical protein [Hydrotalea flava]RWZ87918.1 MAG: hypothetical protein EO766_09600 [Hydrotalea sp. AMD]
MERVDTLINKLNEQWAKKESSAALLATVQLLLAALQQDHHHAPVGNHVSVVMPFHFPASGSEQAMPIPEKKILEDNKDTSNTYIANLFQKPTFIPHPNKPASEFKEGMEGDKSLNEKLKTEKKELAATLQEAPIKDLHKAIGINDRYLFVNELFHGDETMFERSIKTINGFASFPEASFWMEKELKLKLGWQDENETIATFYQLVKRRFS